MAPLLSAAAWLCAAGLGSVAAEPGARLTATGREVRVDGGSRRSTGELELVPRIALLRHGKLDVTLSYAPRLTVPVDLSAGAPELASVSAVGEHGEVLHEVAVAIEGAPGRNLSLRVSADGASGRIDVRRSEVYADEALPVAGRLAWRSARAAAEAVATLTRRTTLSGRLGAYETGGADREAREVVPLGRGATIATAVRYGATRRDELALALDASYSRLLAATRSARTAIVRLGGGWTHALRPTLAARAASGVAWGYTAESVTGSTRGFTPFAEAGLSHAAPRPSVATELALRLMPSPNAFDGGVDQRVEASASTRWRASVKWELNARVAAAAMRSYAPARPFWTGERHAELASLDLRATFAFARRGTLSLGPKVRRQRGHEPGVPTFSEWGAALELYVGARWPE